MNKLSKSDFLEKLGNLKNLELQVDFDSLIFKAKKWGFKYVVLTTRHHEGFSLYDTKGLSDFDIKSLKNQTDLVKDFVQACRKYDIKPVLYHTTLDWYDDRFEKDFNAYLDYLYKSVEILTKNYGEIAGFWFDGNWSKPDADWNETKLYQMIRQNQPNAVIVNNSGLNAKGAAGNEFLEVVTYEQGALLEQLVEVQENLAREVCETINDHWGVAKLDYNFKSIQQVITHLVNVVANKANYLLNIGLDKNGIVGNVESQILNMVGDWIDKFGKKLFENFNLVDRVGENYLIETRDHYTIFLANIKSGGHVDEIAYGSKELKSIVFNNVTKKIKTMQGLDDKEIYEFDQKSQKLSFIPKSFKYGNNTIYKVIICEKEGD
ncbi:alpha-L-fucosidase [Spiroplasma sabaudiense]|nr:alpha-L-fucosidase [Spiroplasma sabaudiense]